MIISTDNKNILLDNKIIFTRKKPNLKFFENKNKNKNKNNNKNDFNKCVIIKEKKKLPAPLWCINELDGCICNKKFGNINDYNIHKEVCLFDKNNLEEYNEEKNNKSPEDLFYDFDDETINIIESYERMTGDKILMQFLLGQINYNLIDKIIKEYYYDIEDEYQYDTDDSLIIDYDIY